MSLSSRSAHLGANFRRSDRFIHSASSTSRACAFNCRMSPPCCCFTFSHHFSYQPLSFPRSRGDRLKFVADKRAVEDLTSWINQLPLSLSTDRQFATVLVSEAQTLWRRWMSLNFEYREILAREGRCRIIRKIEMRTTDDRWCYLRNKLLLRSEPDSSVATA